MDDKDNVVAALMMMLQLKRLNVPLDRDVIFLAEAGEEASTQFGIKFMVEKHWPEIDAEYCFAEGGGVTRTGGQVRFASVADVREDSVRRHAHRAWAGGPRLGALAHQRDRPPVAGRRPHRRVAGADAAQRHDEGLLRAPGHHQRARRGRALPQRGRTRGQSAAIQEHFAVNEPRHNSMLRTSVSPNMFNAGYQVNVIPSEATATLDVRALPDEDIDRFVDELRTVVNDPAVEVARNQRNTRPARRRRASTRRPSPPSRLR